MLNSHQSSSLGRADTTVVESYTQDDSCPDEINTVIVHQLGVANWPDTIDSRFARMQQAASFKEFDSSHSGRPRHRVTLWNPL